MFLIVYNDYANIPLIDFFINQLSIIIKANSNSLLCIFINCYNKSTLY